MINVEPVEDDVEGLGTKWLVGEPALLKRATGTRARAEYLDGGRESLCQAS